MAVIMILEVPGATVEQYDAVEDTLGMHGERAAPPGLIVHTCAVTDDGLLITDVWESAEAMERFLHEELGAAIAASGMPQAQPRVLPLRTTLVGSA